MSLNIKHKRSAVAASVPTPAQLEDGELAVNYNGTDPALYIKDSTGAVIRIAGNGAVGSPPDASETVKGIAEIATQAEATAGTDDTRTITPLKMATYVAANPAPIPGPTPPPTPSTGDSYWAGDTLFIWDGTAWVPAVPDLVKYTIQNDDTDLVGGDLTTAVNAALIANGDITGATDLRVGEQTEIADSGNPDANANSPVGRYFYDGVSWFVAGGGGTSVWTRTGTTLGPATAGDVVAFSAGTAALPGLTPAGDPDTGIAALSANTWSVVTQGLERVRYTDAGDVLIGGTLPATPNVTLTAAGAGNFKSNVEVEGTLGTATVVTQLGNKLDVNDFAITTTVVDGDIDLDANGAGLLKVTEYNLVAMEVVTKHDIGTGANEVPVNGFLGTLAYKDDLAIADGALVANLPTSPTARVGNIARVTDGAASLTWGATVTGGGTAQYLVWYNGTNWTVFGA